MGRGHRVMMHGLVGTSVLFVACDSPTAVRSPLLQTEAASYGLEVNGIGLETSLGYSFTNETGQSVYIVNCNGSFSLKLERQEGQEWVDAWSPFVPGCLSPPIVIEPGEVFSDTIRVWGAPPGAHAGPQFDLEDPSGTYRIVWLDALSSYQDRLPFGNPIPLEYRVSNAFELRAP